MQVARPQSLNPLAPEIRLTADYSVTPDPPWGVKPFRKAVASHELFRRYTISLKFWSAGNRAFERQFAICPAVDRPKWVGIGVA